MRHFVLLGQRTTGRMRSTYLVPTVCTLFAVVCKPPTVCALTLLLGHEVASLPCSGV